MHAVLNIFVTSQQLFEVKGYYVVYDLTVNDLLYCGTEDHLSPVYFFLYLSLFLSLHFSSKVSPQVRKFIFDIYRMPTRNWIEGERAGCVLFVYPYTVVDGLYLVYELTMYCGIENNPSIFFLFSFFFSSLHTFCQRYHHKHIR